MMYKEKKQIIFLWIQKTTDYKKYIFDIENYFEITQDIILKDLEILNKVVTIDSCQELRILMNIYLDSFDLRFIDLVKELIRLILYAKFLISMHKWCIDLNIRNYNIIRQNHCNRFLRWTKSPGCDQDFLMQEELKWFLVDLRYRNI